MLNLLRSGLTIWDDEHRLHGATDLPLSTAGRAALEQEISHVYVGKLRTVHHPPDEAATVTAEMFARRAGAKTRVLRELADPDLGLLDGLTMQIFAERFPKRCKLLQEDPLSLSPPEGEAIAQARSRIFAAVAKTVRKAKSSESAIILHDVGVGLLRCVLAERPSANLWKMLRDRPYVERYALPAGMVEKLESVAEPVTTV